MKKLILILAVFLMGASLFALDLQVGPVAMYVSPIQAPADIPSYKNLGLEDFRFGADLRVNLGILQGAALLLVEAPGPDGLKEPGQFVLIPTVGVSLDVLFLELGLGIGPALEIHYGDAGITQNVDFGLHAKGTANVNLGFLSPGVIVGTAINVGEEGVSVPEVMDFYVGLALLLNL